MTHMTEYIIIVTACAHKKEAETIAHILLKDRVVACATITEGVASHFWWKGSLDSADEVLLITKTIVSQFPYVEARIKEHHSYEVPEIVAFPIMCGSQEYLQWITESLTKEG